ncbi:aldolase/citrate lyase family protein [Sphingomonas sp. BIUV-7]|uniref:Aldolase/citrate lyase family protein n=1 Tax=Sphingomonas natans TaxID=3063330 RepID=A0ABT8Y8A6_9SPHN|nr:aldolase/citrate lyase family protein [Sphingomonas sp. BIUV-7]MDO6414549.1 aldolase/citrate lyase family protein [Sphingomonas sp. BIUV-7]
MNPIRKALQGEAATLGSWYGIRCNLIAERFGAIGFDWVIVDLQHGTASWDGLLSLLQSLQLGGTYSLVRVGGHDPAEIGRALDIGAVGVVVPMVSTPEQAKLVADATRYPPHGTRSIGAARNTLGGDPLSQDPFCVVMIETEEGMRNLDAIVATPGVDCVLLGGADLAVSMGLPPEQIYATTPPPAVLEAMTKLADACQRHGKIAGNAAMDASEIEALLARGIRFIPVGAATLFLTSAAKRALQDCRSAVGEFAETPVPAAIAV